MGVRYSGGGCIPHIGHFSTDSGERVVRKTFADMVEATGIDSFPNVFL